ncbi:MAG: hypothetical protein J3K34DRAFT_426590 [Monoraphidium minutum]|nr:MAG: hypothetical protein J3K34DRAFT_426590 [Monoraphidium minutum]
MAVDGTALATSLGINGALCVAFMLIFSVLRVRPITRRFFAPKRYDPEVLVKPRRLRMGLTSWIGPTFSYPETEVISVAGMDVVVFLRLLKYGLTLFTFATLWCCIVLIPINATGGGLKMAGNTTASDIDYISASNIPNRSPGNQRFWAHMISAYVISIFALWLLFSFSKDISKLRAWFISTQPRSAENHTVLVTDMPGLQRGTLGGYVPVSVKSAAGGASKGLGGALDSTREAMRAKLLSGSLKGDADAENAGEGADAAGPRKGAPVEPLAMDVLDPWASAEKHLTEGGTIESMVSDEFTAVYGGSHVAAVNPVYDTAKIEPLVNKYNAAKSQLSDIVDDYIGKLRRKSPVDPAKRKQVTLLPALTPAWAKEKYSVGAKPVKVDALEYLPQAMDTLRGDIKEAATKASEAYLPAAFVTFNDRYTQTLAATGLHAQDELAWRVQGAPGADEIIWGNLGLRYWSRITRTIAMWALFIAILVFYLPVVAAIQAVVNLENVRNVPGLGVITRIPFVTQVLQGIMPSLVLKIFLAILPMILNKMNRYAGMVSVSQVDFGTVNKFFIFQVFALFIFTFITGSALSQIQAIIDKPAVLVSLLGVAAPQQATFFMTYIMISALATGLGVLRLVPLIIYFIKDKLAGTEKAKYRLWAKQTHVFGTFVANHSMVILLGLAFCVISPLITPFCLLYFALAYLVQKYQLIYVLRHDYEAAGKMWIVVFHQIMVGVYFLQLIVMTVLGVKRFPYAALILPLTVCTAVFHWAMSNVFKRPWTLTCVREAALLDKREAEPLTAEENAVLKQIYLNPAFKLDDAEHDELLANARTVDEQLKSGGTGELDIKDVEMPSAVEAE